MLCSASRAACITSLGDAADEQRGGGVYDDQRARFVAAFARQNFADDLRRFLPAIGFQMFEISPRFNPKSSGAILKFRLILFAGHFGDESFAVKRHFVQTVGAVNDPRAFRSEQRQSLRHRLRPATLCQTPIICFGAFAGFDKTVRAD